MYLSSYAPSSDDVTAVSHKINLSTVAGMIDISRHVTVAAVSENMMNDADVVRLHQHFELQIGKREIPS
jgi:hypothetical protein